MTRLMTLREAQRVPMQTLIGISERFLNTLMLMRYLASQLKDKEQGRGQDRKVKRRRAVRLIPRQRPRTRWAAISRWAFWILSNCKSSYCLSLLKRLMKCMISCLQDLKLWRIKLKISCRKMLRSSETIFMNSSAWSIKNTMIPLITSKELKFPEKPLRRHLKIE